MYAVIKTSGKQFRVKEGQTIKIDRLDNEVGSDVDFTNVLMLVNDDNVQVGTPLIEGAKVTGTVLEHGRNKKIEIIKFKRRKHHMKKQGHRQNYTAVKITTIS